jgi:3-hydroxyacyl-CoA dehydrogenase
MQNMKTIAIIAASFIGARIAQVIEYKKLCIEVLYYL